MATLVRRVQEMEKEKLQLTARLQILRHGLALDSLQADAEDFADADRAARTAALRSEEAAELRGKLTELTVQLNETLDEVRCELADGDAEAVVAQFDQQGG